MSYSISVDQLERFDIQFRDEPKYIHGFRMAPEHREAQLNFGDWLILAFAIWKMDDRKSINDALQMTKAYDGRFNLAVRPFELTSEFNNWLRISPEPTVNLSTESFLDHGNLQIYINADNSMTPFWFWLRNGEIISQAAGPMNQIEIETFISSALKH